MFHIMFYIPLLKICRKIIWRVFLHELKITKVTSKITLKIQAVITDYDRTVVRFSNLRVLIEIDCLFLSSFLKPQIPGKLKSPHH